MSGAKPPLPNLPLWGKEGKFYNYIFRGVGRGSSVGIETRYGLDGPRIESRWGARFPAPVQTGPGVHPTSCATDTGTFPGVKRPGRGVDHPLPSSAEVEETVELSTPPLALRGLF